METNTTDDKRAIVKKYKLRTAGAQGATIEITLPKEAVEREARLLGIGEEEAVEKLLGVWRYNSFKGLHLNFEVKTEVDNVITISPILPKRKAETCAACKFWAGHCLNDKINRIAHTDACELFEYRDNGGEK